jgi:hypothetical protein
VEYRHSLLAATLVCPGHNPAAPLQPEFIVPQDGHDKQDCESRAMRRWLAAHGAHYARLRPVYLGDDLYLRQPSCQAVLDADAHFRFVCKPSSHRTIEEYRAGIELSELITRVKIRGKWGRHRYRWLSDVPLRDGDDALKVNWFMLEILDPAGKTTYRNSCITDLPMGPDNVAELAACRRARWKVENEAEGRKRGVQHPQDQGLPPGAQFRARPAEPCHRARHPEPAGIRLPHRMPTGGAGVAGRPIRRRHSPGLLPASPSHHHLPGVSLLGSPARHAGVHQTATARA